MKYLERQEKMYNKPTNYLTGTSNLHTAQSLSIWDMALWNHRSPQVPLTTAQLYAFDNRETQPQNHYVRGFWELFYPSATRTPVTKPDLPYIQRYVTPPKSATVSDSFLRGMAALHEAGTTRTPVFKQPLAPTRYNLSHNHKLSQYRNDIAGFYDKGPVYINPYDWMPDQRLYRYVFEAVRDAQNDLQSQLEKFPEKEAEIHRRIYELHCYAENLQENVKKAVKKQFLLKGPAHIRYRVDEISDKNVEDYFKIFPNEYNYLREWVRFEKIDDVLDLNSLEFAR
ncbi:MAG: hypothetical protein IJ523_00415 [Succinivibrionaceae bacterium]|nr:hypothetical protein [Succinivibrionaceae bacterium]